MTDREKREHCTSVGFLISSREPSCNKALCQSSLVAHSTVPCRDTIHTVQAFLLFQNSFMYYKIHKDMYLQNICHFLVHLYYNILVVGR